MFETENNILKHEIWEEIVNHQICVFLLKAAKFLNVRQHTKFIPKIRFEKSFIHQWGVYSTCVIQAGDPIVEYTGDLIRISVTEKRQKYYEDKKGNYGSYIFKLDDDVFIDATSKGGIARFLNHSCEPNCKTRILVEADKDPPVRHVVICAKRLIEPFEELTYDYKLPYEEDSKKIVCQCGSSLCREFLNHNPYVSDAENLDIVKQYDVDEE